jgi:hypothetical protein
MRVAPRGDALASVRLFRRARRLVQLKQQQLRSAPKPPSEFGLAQALADQSSSATLERASISGLAESMRLHATLLQQAGKGDEASILANQALRLLEANRLNLSGTEARSLRLVAGGHAIAGGRVPGDGVGGR